MDKIAFGERFKYVRTELARLNTENFAKEIGISTGFVNTIEKGKSTPNVGVIDSIYRKYSVNCHWLTTGEGEPKPGVYRYEVATTPEDIRRASESNVSEVIDIGAPLRASKLKMRQLEEELVTCSQAREELRIRLDQTERILDKFNVMTPTAKGVQHEPA